MSKFCENCGKGPSVGNNVSHSMRHTKRRFLPNLAKTQVYNKKTKKFESKKVCTKCLKTSVKTTK